jgi:hypothetical protein
VTDNENRTAEETIAEAIDGAEEIRDPLGDLVETTKLDSSAPFTPEVLKRLAALKQDDRAAFEKLRAQLKKAGCRMKALDEALAEESVDGGGRGPSQSDILLKLVEAVELFHNPDKVGFADLDINGHRETWAIRSRGFRQWLARCFYEATAGAPNSEALQSALNVIEAKARFDASERVVHVRVGGMDGKIYLDLCDENWRAVEIDVDGWRVVDSPPVRFRRAAGMLPLPVAGGSIEELRPFLNVRSNNEFVLTVAWMLAALRDRGPYPVLALFGEQGTAKSTFAEILRMLLDPNTMPSRAPPREDRDLFIAAMNGHVLVFDNISDLAEWISDTLCRLSTGGGFATRQLYTDQDEVLLNATRPSILNGIEDVVNRPDLADRTVCLTLQPIPDDKRRLETELWAAFDAARSCILGALLDAVAVGLKRLPKISLRKLPRMADFALWATACETALRKEDGTFWNEGTFMEAYRGAIDDTVESVLDASLVATAVRTFMEPQAEWTGTATDLLDLLGKVAGEKATKAKTWPADATRLGGKLRREATFLRKVGIEVVTGARQGRVGTRIITITNTLFSGLPESGGTSASVAAATSICNDSHYLAQPPAPTLARAASAAAGANGHSVSASVHTNSLKNKAAAATADADAEIPRDSGSRKKEVILALSNERICELAGDYIDAAAAELEETGNVDRVALDRRLRETLAANGVAPESVKVEFARIMETLTAF